MKVLANVLAVIGIIGLAWAVIGRFLVDGPSVLGTFISGGIQAPNLMIAANSVLLLAIICKLTAK